MLVVVVEHQRADPQRRRVRGRHRDRGHRRELVAEVVGHEQRRVAEVFELARLVAPRARRRRLARPARRIGTAWSCVLLGTMFRRAARRPARASPWLRSGTTMYDICQRSRRRSSSSTICDSVPTSVTGASMRVVFGHAERAGHRFDDRTSRSSVTCTNPTSVWISRSSNRSPAASRNHASFWSVAAGISDCAVVARRRRHPSGGWR